MTEQNLDPIKKEACDIAPPKPAIAEKGRDHAMVKERARAKINLGLDVLGTRPDGYHEVRMVMQTLKLYDLVTVEAGAGDPAIRVTCNFPYVPTDERNLAFRAAKMFCEEFHIEDSLSIDLAKRIPVAAGLAGGSSNAAAVLRALRRMYAPALSDEDLRDRGLLLGADVPYCVRGGTMLAEGLGEKLSSLPSMPHCFVVLAKPSFSLSTGEIYRALPKDPAAYDHGNVDGVLRGLEENDLERIAVSMTNVLETVSIGIRPQIGEIKDALCKNGALGAMMSGSGPTVFGLFATAESAKTARASLKDGGFSGKTFLTEVEGRSEDDKR